VPSELPIACSLEGSDLRERLAEMAEVGRSGLIGVESEPGTAVLRFRQTEGMSDRLARIVAAESECCGFLDMELEERDGSLQLTIDSPEGAGPVVEELVAAFSGRLEAAR
jgi:hypothetical protein